MQEPIRLLVVDDDLAFLELIALHLTKKGYEVHRASGGQQALQLLRDHGGYQVLITDLMMPGMSGLELLRMAKKVDPALEIIAITAAGSLEMAISALREYGAFDYLTKPLDMMGELSIAVEKAAQHRALKLEREMLRDRLVNAAQRLEAILESTGDTVVAANDEDEIVLASPGADRLLRVQEGRTGGLGLSLPSALEELRDRWRGLDDHGTAWVEIPWPPGRVQLVQFAPIFQAEGVYAGWVMALRDISYQKRLELFVVRNYTRVTAKIRQPMEQAATVLNQLENSLKGETGDSIKVIHQLRHLFQEARQGSDELLSLKGNGSNQGSRSSTVSLIDFLRNKQGGAGKDMQSGKHVRLQWKLDGDLPEIKLDHSTLAELYHHLMQRAALRSEQGDDVHISAQEKDELVWLEVTDFGPKLLGPMGAPTETVGDASTIEWMERSEIELAVVKTLADQLDAQVWMRDVDDRATGVSICFAME